MLLSPIKERPREERRQFVRYRPKGGTIAVNDHALGPVINISMGGLSFRYLEGSSTEPHSDSLGIFLGSDDVLIDKITTKVISDQLIAQGSVFLQISTRQRSIQFLNLSERQRKNLKAFINEKTQGTY
ncbi:MAG: PilZ domain-containing protein [Proteobacteria bacterium]|nr:PilZ domain-containing protein [Pseudomonadota bacterium]MBU1056966.1 PilZ domain-containing protein [Pseudomonadota bacterium]